MSRVNEPLNPTEAHEYFYAEDDGQEVFAVKVSKTKSCVLRLTKNDVSAEIVCR